MRSPLTIAATCLSVALLGASGDSASHVRSQITDLNLLLQKATQRYDVKTLSRFATDDFTLVNGSGEVCDKAAFLKDAGDRSAVWEANDPFDVRVRSYNDDCAIVVALLHIKFRQGGKLHDVIGRYTDIWIKQGSAWRYPAGQATLYKKLK